MSVLVFDIPYTAKSAHLLANVVYAFATVSM